MGLTDTQVGPIACIALTRRESLLMRLDPAHRNCRRSLAEIDKITLGEIVKLRGQLILAFK